MNASSSAYSNNNFNNTSDLRFGVNQNPDPSRPSSYAYPGPYTGQTPTQPKPGRDSPGYGDLGVRQFNGVISTTQPPQNLSVSFDETASVDAPIPPASRPPQIPNNMNYSRGSTSSQLSNSYAAVRPQPSARPGYARQSPNNSSRVLTPRPDDTMV